jgi:adenosyl cobinamide kinase/adenosyl cobinamide phosphate guanylyltransferase
MSLIASGLSGDDDSVKNRAGEHVNRRHEAWIAEEAQAVSFCRHSTFSMGS